MKRGALCSILALAAGGCTDRFVDDLGHTGGLGDSDADPTEGLGDSSVLDPEDPDDPDGTDPECVTESDCDPGQTCFEGTCVGTGEFRVSLSWQVVSDFDLHVRTPAGVEIWFAEPDGGEGYLDVDDCVGQQCRDNNGTHVENVFFSPAAPRGPYDVWVVNFDGARSGDFEIQVAGAVETRFSGSLPAHSGAVSETFRFTY
jgi:hypothetical protein